MKNMHTTELKSLNNVVASVSISNENRELGLAEGYINSLTEKARQVISEAEVKTDDKNSEIMKRLAAKALKRARRKAGRYSNTDDAYAGSNPKAAKTDPDMTNRGAVAEELIYEVAAPGYEDWASDPKVKASFKKQYGNRWKQVMCGRSWNMKKMDEEAELAEGSYVHSKGELKKAIKGSKKEIVKAYKKDDKKEMQFWMQNKKDAESQMNEEESLAEGVSAKRMRIIRKHLVSGKPVTGAVKDFMQRSFKKKFYKDKTKFGGATSAVLGRAALKHSAMKAKGLAARIDPRAEQLDEAIVARAARENIKTDRTGIRPEPGVQRRLVGRRTQIAKKYGINPKNREAIGALSKERRNTAMRAKGLDPIGARYESVQLDEAGYKKLMRLKRAAYKADLASRSSVLDPTDARSQGKKYSRLKRAEAEQESKVAARMAMKGGASAEAVKGGGSLIGKSGKPTMGAANLADKRKKAIARFGFDSKIIRYNETGNFNGKLSDKRAGKKRAIQQARAKFAKQAQTGDFGQNNQEGMRPRYNYLKRTGKLKTK